MRVVGERGRLLVCGSKGFMFLVRVKFVHVCGCGTKRRVFVGFWVHS